MKPLLILISILLLLTSPLFSSEKKNDYDGESKEGLPHGQGTYYHRDGKTYKGEWKDGIPPGPGIFTYPDGTKYVGELKDGKL